MHRFSKMKKTPTRPVRAWVVFFLSVSSCYWFSS
jgi:hypothetical protein